MQNGEWDPYSDPISDDIKVNFKVTALAGDVFWKEQFMTDMFSYFGVSENSYVTHCNKEFSCLFSN